MPNQHYYPHQQQAHHGGRHHKNQPRGYGRNNRRPKKPPRTNANGSSKTPKSQKNTSPPSAKLSPQAASFVTPLTQSDIDLNTLRSQLRSSEISNLESLERVKSVNVCKGNDRYVVLEIEGGGIYEGGKYDVEIFFGKEYPKVFPRCRLATKIISPYVSPVGVITFPELSGEVGVAAPVKFIRDVVLSGDVYGSETEMSMSVEEIEKAKAFNRKYGMLEEGDMDPEDPMLNYGPNRVSGILGSGDEDFEIFKGTFYARIRREERKERVKGFVRMMGGKGREEEEEKNKNESSILSKWSKNATLDSTNSETAIPSQFQPQNPVDALWSTLHSKRSAPLNYSTHSFMTLSHAISSPTLSAVRKTMGFKKMTLEQCQMLPAVLEGKDILVRSNTGTGKTISFLIPCIERASTFRRPSQVSALIISPTRELASQTAEMANQLVVFNTDIIIDIFMGGKNINSEVARCEEGYPTILIVTPGRMLDHLERDEGKLEAQLKNLNTLVLDESDQLLAAGFLPSIETIIQYIPMTSPDLQTMMFTATVPPSLHEVVSSTLKSDGYFLDADESKTKWGLSQFNVEKNVMLNSKDSQPRPKIEPITNAMKRAAKVAADRQARGEDIDREVAKNPSTAIANFKDMVGTSIVQHYVLCDIQDQAIMLKRLLGLACARKDYKVIVFFQTARATAYFVSLMSELHSIDVLEMHSRKSQPHRAHVSHKFKTETDQILFTSDVSARGVDYPNVTCCIQFGLPQNVENYIHRCGRSGRGVQGGLSIVLLSDFEAFFLEELKEQGIDVPRLNVKLTRKDEKENEELKAKLKGKTDVMKSKELLNRAKLHYQAWIGYYCSHTKRLGIEKEDIVNKSIVHALKVLCLEEVPAIKKSTAEKMAVDGIEGIRIEE
ncbi:hypothetical protein TL16_g04217 [Triparma laevis f. inornata]|uniref:ATP-dependent RNA helicase n=2 Tax=Triparma laevis TaxID=1534972 RepID=A0A9W7C5M2_9STRA|nr:hypothetical protein TL16_g04217 [Triparma laevis f. inornata]GMI00096.1 hypothetical protein TrLO_g11674 [Triparma laevis f. longispina]